MRQHKTGRSAKTPWEDFRFGSVLSLDGTTIRYRQLGHGTGVVLFHGSLSSAYNHIHLARKLAESFTVYLPDRRVLGLGGPPYHEYGLQQEVEDLDALLSQTGAHQVLGVSAGAIICLEAALTLSSIHRAVIFEPPLSFARPVVAALQMRYDQELGRGDVAAALVTASKGAQMGSPFVYRMPCWLMERMTRLMLAYEDKYGSGEYVPTRALATALGYDFQLVVERSERTDRYRDVRSEMLLLGGSKSPVLLKSSLDALERVLPRVQRIEMLGLDHAATWNEDRGGRPDKVAQVLSEFFI